jgi:integrase
MAPQIRTITLGDGSRRYEARVDAGTWPNGKRRQVTIRRKLRKDVAAELSRIGYQVPRGEYVARSRATVNEIIDAYLTAACRGKEANTVTSYRQAFRIPRERIGHRPAQSVTRDDVEALVDYALTRGRSRGGRPGTGLSARSAQLMVSQLSAAFEQAADDGKVPRNPCRRVKVAGGPRTPRATWSAGELRAFLAVADADRLAAAWRLSAYGLRRGEVCGLRWEDIDLDARTVRIGRARVLAGGGQVVKAPKSARGYRTLPLDDALAAALEALRLAQIGEMDAAGPAYANDGWVVADELGCPFGPDRYSDEFHRVAARAGVPRIRLHEARHTVNSLMAAAGVPDHIRAAWCGHTKAVNVAVYTHARPEDLVDAGAVVARLMSDNTEAIG